MRHAHDPDTDLEKWLREGAPLGIRMPVTSCGIFPQATDTSRQWSPGDISSEPTGWENYRSAEDDPAVCAELLERMTANGWAVEASCWTELLEHAESDQVTLNKLALISKQRPDNTWKHRLIWDLLRSEVNGFISQGERIVLPRLRDLVQNIIRILSGGPCTLFGTDISDAFHQIPLHRDERQFTATSFAKRLFLFSVLVFGAASAPTVWGRFAAFIGRTSAAVLHDTGALMEIYVDDPIYAIPGNSDQASEIATIATLGLCSLGFPLAWHKTDAGSTLTWIGASVTMSHGDVTVTVPEDKVNSILDELTAIHGLSVVTKKRLRVLSGKLNFIAGLVPPLRPFISPLWAAGSKTTANDASSSGPNRAAGRKLPSHLVHVARFHHAIQWLAAFFKRQRGTLCRNFPSQPRAAQTISFVCDASPWGIGLSLIHI